jgi:glutathione peroxidase-family protein
MTNLLSTAIIAVVLLLCIPCAAHTAKNYGFHSSGRLEENEFYSLEFDGLQGENIDFGQFRDRVVLITNVASECGYTQINYDQLRQLKAQFGNDLAVVLIPSNDFGEQEPGSEAEIADFIKQHGSGEEYFVLSKAAMNGPEQHPLIDMLKQVTNSTKRPIKWNFETKWIVSPDGKFVSRYSDAFEPFKLVESIKYYQRNKRPSSEL